LPERVGVEEQRDREGHERGEVATIDAAAPGAARAADGCGSARAQLRGV
jgi:hypothetical protein